jgi:hypothetical protein
LFIDGKPIKNIDPINFRFIGNYVFRDKDSAYFFGFYNNINDCVIRGVNPDKLQLIEYPWAKADSILIHGRDTLIISDINDFVPLSRDWGKTKKYVISNSEILKEADPKTFEIINIFTAMDKRYVYEFGKIKE